MSADSEKSGHPFIVAFTLLVIACAILSGIDGGKGLFFGLLIIGIVPMLLLVTWWMSLEGRRDARTLLLVGVGVVFAFLIARQEDRAKKREAEKIEAAKAAARYSAWYNTLSPYEKLQMENERLRRENEALRNARDSSE